MTPTSTLDKRLWLLKWLFSLLHKKHSWTPALIAAELWRFLINVGKYPEVLELFRYPPFAEFARDYPGFALKYLVPGYLARSFTATECTSCFLHHYRRIHAALPEDALRQMLNGYITLYEISYSGSHIAFTIGSPERVVDKEGELSLDLLVDSRRIFSLCFTIVPGWVLKSDAPEAMLISRLQGHFGCNSQVKVARQAFNDYSPRSLLLAALQGIADALRLGEIQAVIATNQKSYIKERSAIFTRGYDLFFAKAGMVKTSAGFYASPIPIAGKPLSSFAGRARSRAKKRRENRQRIRSACADVLMALIERNANFAFGTMRSAQSVVESDSIPASFTPECHRRL